MITATILDAEMRPISEDFQIIDDDFSAVVLAAKLVAKSGQRCLCIMWRRAEDGQVAYYGPRGCSLQPHWYGVLGRPSEITGGRRVNVWLDQASVERAESLGDGNVSAGIRLALSEYDEKNLSSLRNGRFTDAGSETLHFGARNPPTGGFSRPA